MKVVLHFRNAFFIDEIMSSLPPIGTYRYTGDRLWRVQYIKMLYDDLADIYFSEVSKPVQRELEAKWERWCEPIEERQE